MLDMTSGGDILTSHLQLIQANVNLPKTPLHATRPCPPRGPHWRRYDRMRIGQPKVR